MGFGKIITKTTAFCAKHSSEILLGVGIAGLLTTTILVAKNTPKAVKVIEDHNDELNDIKDREAEALKTEETAKAFKKEKIDLYLNTGKELTVLYGPSVLLAGSSVYCLLKSHNIEHQKLVGVTTALQISEAARREYSKKVVDIIGDKKEKEIRDAINKDRVAANPPNLDDPITTAEHDTLCFDAATGRYFRSNGTKLHQAMNRLNRRMMNEMYISLNEFYDEVGLDRVKIGDDLGWNINDGEVELHLTSMLSDEEIPILVLDYRFGPRYDFRNLH